MLDQRFAHHPKRSSQAGKSKRKLKTIAGRLVRELERKLSEGVIMDYLDDLITYRLVLWQKQHDKNKIYSLHETEVACIAKGKKHKPYEFGSKVSFAMVPGSNIIVGVQNYTGNPHDSTTLEDTINHAEKITGHQYENVIVDRGYRGKKKVNNTNVIIPGRSMGSAYDRRKIRKKCQSRAAIEPIIGHVKHDCRMARNYLKGTWGDEINALMAASAFNMRQMLRKIKEEIIFSLFEIYFFVRSRERIVIDLT
jgi:IS5 family transposase